jgi:hypothetical protein
MEVHLHNKKLFPTGFWADFADFVSRPYWERLWIVQEVALSHQNITVLCGSEIVPWLILAHAILIIRDSFQWVYVTYPEAFNPNKDETISNISMGLVRIYNLFILGLPDLDGPQEGCSPERLIFKTPDLHHILRVSTKSKAKKDEDRVYGILGLVEQRVADLVEPAIGRKSVTDILTEFAKAAIIGSGKLNLLAASGDCAIINSEVQVPTWVPDLRISRSTWIDLIPKVPYAASEGRNMEVLFDQDRPRAKGFVIDEVDGLGFAGPLVQDGVNFSVVPPRSNQNPYGTETERRDALWRALVANRDKAGNVVQDTYPSPLDIP